MKTKIIKLKMLNTLAFLLFISATIVSIPHLGLKLLVMGMIVIIYEWALDLR